MKREISLAKYILRGVKKINPKKVSFNLHSPIIKKNDLSEVKKCLH